MLAIAALLTTSVTAQYNPTYRNVFWFHGVQGDVNSMKALSDYFSAQYKINSYHPAYQSNRGLVYAANQWNSIDFGQQPNDITIAHSMGGLVARQYDRQAISNKKLDGLITLCSPHQGAEFANSFDNGKVRTMFEKSISDGLEGYSSMGHLVGNLAEYHENVLRVFGQYDSYIRTRTAITHNIVGLFFGGVFYYWTTSFLVNLVSASEVNDKVNMLKNGVASSLQTLIGRLAGFVFGSQDEYHPASKDDLKPNSPIIVTLGNTALTCPRIAISCTEEYPAGIRFLGSQLSLMSQNSPGIGQISDGNFLSLTSAIVSDSRKCRDEYASWYRSASWWSLGLLNSHYRDKRDAFNRQANFWDNGFEREYQKCLGSIYYTTETFTITELEWVCSGSAAMQAGSPFIPTAVKDYDPNCWQWVTRTYTNTIESIHTNDGIVIQPSQEALTGASIIRIPSTNHEQAKRSFGVVNALESRFDDQNNYFYIPRK